MMDELEWLRKLEQAVQEYHRQARAGGDAVAALVGIKGRINGRLIELLEQRCREDES